MKYCRTKKPFSLKFAKNTLVFEKMLIGINIDLVNSRLVQKINYIILKIHLYLITLYQNNDSYNFILQFHSY